MRIPPTVVSKTSESILLKKKPKLFSYAMSATKLAKRRIQEKNGIQ